MKVLYSRTLYSENVKEFIEMLPVFPITVRPVVIYSIRYEESYVIIWKDAEDVEVEGFIKYYNLNAIKPAIGTESYIVG
jgi:hypothetical protein